MGCTETLGGVVTKEGLGHRVIRYVYIQKGYKRCMRSKNEEVKELLDKAEVGVGVFVVLNEEGDNNTVHVYYSIGERAGNVDLAMTLVALEKIKERLLKEMPELELR